VGALEGMMNDRYQHIRPGGLNDVEDSKKDAIPPMDNMDVSIYLFKLGLEARAITLL